MDEYTMPEQHLSEELLQQITGGCKECNRDKLAINQHLISNDIHENLARSIIGDHTQNDRFQFHLDKMDFHLDKAEKASQRIIQREATPGHVILPEPQLPPGRKWIM
jgi:hypothetical protein